MYGCLRQFVVVYSLTLLEDFDKVFVLVLAN